MIRLSVTLAVAVLFAGPAYLFQRPLADDDGETRVTASK
jgi:hypothetical protein